MTDNSFKEVDSSNISPKHNFYKNLFKFTLTKPSFYIPFALLTFIFLCSFISYLLIDKSVLQSVNFNNAYITPNFKYPFGTNKFGQNMFLIILVATYNTLKLAFLATFINVLFALIIGILWGNSNKLNSLMLFIKGVFDSVPKLSLYIIVVYALGNNFISLLLVIVIFNWLDLACLIRNNLLVIRTKDYNVASKLNKTSLFKISLHNYLPPLIPIIFNFIAISIPYIISFEISISYFGFSIIENNISLGNLIYNVIYNNSYFDHPYLLFIPLIVLFVINLCFFFISKTISKISIKEGDK